MECRAQIESNTALLWQPVQEYFSHARPGESPVFERGTRRVNSFLRYSHLGTDFGFHGPAEFEIEWRKNEVRANLRQQPDLWAGMWHSLAGLAANPKRTLNFSAPFPEWIEARLQPKIEQLEVHAIGEGNLKLEIKGTDQSTPWSETVHFNDSLFVTRTLPLPTDELANSKFLNWTVEPGSDIALNRLSLGMRFPVLPIDLQTFLMSYAKLSRCYEGGEGLVRDRAHTEGGAFDSIPGTGFFVLATCAAATTEIDVVKPEFARNLLRDIHAKVSTIPKARGLLPHFVRIHEGRYQIHQGTEFSTIDTSIYFHCMLLASAMLGEREIRNEILREIQFIDFQALKTSDGTISHGWKTDGVTLLPSTWRDWGGETALVMMLEAIAGSHPARPLPMQRPGRVWQGTGFIAEIQSLFYPDFDRDAPDAVNQISWLQARKSLLEEQQKYIQHRWRGTLAAEIGLYGFSAGESAYGDSYHVGGSDLPNQDLIHPHYLLMSGGLRTPIRAVYDLLNDMQRIGFFPPYGLAENITVTGSSYLPMEGSLNAGFESIAAYHLLCKNRGIANAIYLASTNCPHLRRAAGLFYPNHTN